jgi:putative hydrolase of the HAD superfamily
MNIVFDFGAVVVHWRPMELVRQHFPALSTSDAAASQLASSIFSHADWQAFDAGLISPEETVQRTHARLGLSAAALAHMVHCIEDHISPMDSSVQLLEQLHAQRAQHGHRLYFLSNMPQLYARGLEQHAFMRCFDGGIFSGDVQLVKPQLAIYERLQAMYSLQGQPMLFIDDQAANIAAAQELGWQTLHLTEPSSLPQQLLANLAQFMP